MVKKRRITKRSVKKESHSEYSHHYLSSVFVVTLVLTLLGTLISLDRFGYVSDSSMITGLAAANATGDTTLTVSSQTSITNHVSSIDFGTGYVNGTCTECVMDSNGQHNQTGACCIGFNNVESGFLIENTGNINVSLNFSCAGDCTAASFIGGTDPVFDIRAVPNVFAQQSGETSSTDTVQSCFGGFAGGAVNNWTFTEYAPINTTDPFLGLCGNETNQPFGFAESEDAVVLDINVSVPEDADTSGSKTATFNFTATSTG